MRLRLAFLYGDLGLNSETVAAILGISEFDVIETCAHSSIKLRGHVFGELTRKTFLSLAKLLGFDPSEIYSVTVRDEWQTMKAVLGREFLRLANEGTMPWNELDTFIEGLPEVQAEANARVTEQRLRFLYGDLGANLSEVMLILDASKSDVTHRLSSYGIRRHETYHPELDEHVFNELKKRLGADTWPDYWEERSLMYRYWTTVRREAREGLVGLAGKSRVDLTIIDELLADVPTLAKNLYEARLARYDRVCSADVEAASPTLGGA